MSPVVKKKPEAEKIPSKYILLMLSIVCFILMAVTFSGKIPDTFINNVCGVVVVPFQKGLSVVNDVLLDLKNDVKTKNQLIAENEKLKKELDDLKNENTLLLQDKYELAELRNLYELDELYNNYPKTGARVISWNGTNWFNSFVINKGTKDGIAVDMNVISGSGLVGIVTDVGANWAKVTSIIDDGSNVSASILHSQDNLIVSGDLQLANQGYVAYGSLVDNENVVAKGDKVVTSNISDKYLPGILIGYIVTVDTDSNNLTKSGYIEPAVDFSKINEVLVITQLKESMED